jgi:hypothetical protein
MALFIAGMGLGAQSALKIFQIKGFSGKYMGKTGGSFLVRS